MSGVTSLPDGISISQSTPELSVTIQPAACSAPGVPVYPLAANPGQTWDLQDVNGVLTWVQFTAPPGQQAIGLEDGAGALSLDGGNGSILMEP
jgi:hypothetical protein